MFCFFISFSNFTETFIYKFCLRWVAALDFPIALLETFELGPTLFQGPEEAIFPEPLSHSPIHLAVLMTAFESLIKLSLAENCEERSGLFIAPVHTCHLLIFKAPVILFHPASSIFLGW
uniref:Uncharacterized protein n=1 Tax=Theropithecus gelada TaxID=9565 RepID=A0A8D2ENK9_THEGE